MTQYRRLLIRWFNRLDCELAQVTCVNERDAADQLRIMIAGAGNEIAAGDYFKIEDLGATG